MKRIRSVLAMSVLAGLFSSAVLAEQESAMDQLKDAQDSSAQAAQNPSLEGAKEQSGGQFDTPYDRPANSPDGAAAPEPGAPQQDR